MVEFENDQNIPPGNRDLLGVHVVAVVFVVRLVGVVEGVNAVSSSFWVLHPTLDLTRGQFSAPLNDTDTTDTVALFTKVAMSPVGPDIIFAVERAMADVVHGSSRISFLARLCRRWRRLNHSGAIIRSGRVFRQVTKLVFIIIIGIKDEFV